MKYKKNCFDCGKFVCNEKRIKDNEKNKTKYPVCKECEKELDKPIYPYGI